MGPERILTATTRMPRPRLFGATVLLSIAVILFFALLPLAQPPGAGRGSAFNPDNDVVVLKASAMPHRAVLDRGDRRDPPPAQGDGEAILPLIPAIILPAILAPVWRVAWVTPAALHAAPRLLPPARAPPAL